MSSPYSGSQLVYLRSRVESQRRALQEDYDTLNRQLNERINKGANVDEFRMYQLELDVMARKLRVLKRAQVRVDMRLCAISASKMDILPRNRC